MSGILITPEDRIKIKIYVGKGKNSDTYADASRKVLLQDKGVLNDSIEEHIIVFRRPSYKDEVEILAGLVQSGVDTESVSINVAGLSYRRFVMLLDSWSFKDKDGNPIPATAASIDRLHPALGRAITSELDNLI